MAVAGLLIVKWATNPAYASSCYSKTRISLVLLILLVSTKHSYGCFKSIISFGDSIADTGNLIHLSPPSKTPPKACLPPYGETFFHRPTGRFSDGRLIIDFIAEYLSLPFIQPFHDMTNLSRSVNFAVGGATALPDAFFSKYGVQISTANVSLVTQLTWFKDIFLPTLCRKHANCSNFVETSLVLVGEIGGNDYNHAFFGGKSVDVVQSFIPQVIKAISLAINELIKVGVVTMMVPGNFPIGCSSSYLAYFKTSNQKDYDPKTGCLNWLNNFSQKHNKLLQVELNRIRQQNPNIRIIYADYYNAAILFYRSPQKYGFVEGALKACCGGGGRYNVNFTVSCGDRGSNTCKDPSLHVSWDGVHLTEAAYRWIAMGLLRGSFTVPQLKSLCTLSFKNVVGFSDH